MSCNKWCTLSLWSLESSLDFSLLSCTSEHKTNPYSKLSTLSPQPCVSTSGWRRWWRANAVIIKPIPCGGKSWFSTFQILCFYFHCLVFVLVVSLFFLFENQTVHLSVYPMTLLVKSSTNGKRWGMTLLVGMCGTTMVFKAALAERCWNGWNGGCWWPERCRWLIELSRRCLWWRFLKSGDGWKVKSDNALVHMFFHNVNIIYMDLLCRFIYVYVYIYMYLCGYHLYVYIYVYVYIYIISIFLCRILMISHIYLFLLDRWQGGAGSSTTALQHRPQKLSMLRLHCWILGPVQMMGTVVTGLFLNRTLP